MTIVAQLTGRWFRRAGVVLAGLVLAGTTLPASAQDLTWSVVPSRRLL